jgi:RHH-type proline utilization regulon transcriptional repressor/proline dehydrogenase/delta 1-pyrroline-5-carboxylate dehydrogenase
MVVDSSALPEQVVDDVVASAFNSAGQRCSALRVLLVQEEAARRILDMLRAHGHARGRSAHPDTDVGPVIDAILRRRSNSTQRQWKVQVIARAPLRRGGMERLWPLAFGSRRSSQREVSTDPARRPLPVRNPRARSGCVAATGYGLTLGITAAWTVVERVRRRLHVGNTYVNHPTIGAVVGVQPRRRRLSERPKAGSPTRFTGSRRAHLTVNTAAMGKTPELFAKLARWQH